MSTRIQTRSPYYIRPANVTNLVSTQVELYIFSGVIGDKPASPQYTLIKEPINSEESVTFEISELIQDYFEHSYGGSYSGAGSTLWVIGDFQFNDGSTISLSSSTFLAFDSYSTFKNGANYNLDLHKLITGTYVQYKNGTNIVIPINAEIATNVTFKLNGSNVQSTAITDNGNTNQKIQYISYTGSADEIFVEGSIRDSTVIVEEVEECKYTPIKITFINKNGALQDLWFFKKSSENMNVTKNSFNRNLLDRVNVSYTTTDAAKKTYDINANESISINSGFVNEAMNTTFEELLVSNLVWMTKDSTVFPMKVADSSLSFKTSLNDNLINYAINFDYAFDLINNVH
jgi:hypothetical protein